MRKPDMWITGGKRPITRTSLHRGRRLAAVFPKSDFVPTLSNIWIMRRGYGASREEAMADFKAAWLKQRAADQMARHQGKTKPGACDAGIKIDA
jgi:hypothetical protein